MSAWQTHVTKFRASHPKLSMKECMQQASKSYHSKARSAYRSSQAPPPPKFKPSVHLRDGHIYMARSYIVINDTVYLVLSTKNGDGFFVGSMSSFKDKGVKFDLAKQLTLQDVLQKALTAADILV